ncbi:MAG: SOSS complex subunit B family protein [Candidatus Woesearchaeota archaeon]
MKISELQPKQGKIDIQAKVVAKGQIREFNKFGKPGMVCDAEIEDDTGRIKLTLWNEQTAMVNIGDLIEITNGYVNEWQGELQLTTGRFGTLRILEKTQEIKAILETQKQAGQAKQKMQPLQQQPQKKFNHEQSNEQSIKPRVHDDSITVNLKTVNLRDAPEYKKPTGSYSDDAENILEKSEDDEKNKKNKFYKKVSEYTELEIEEEYIE